MTTKIITGDCLDVMRGMESDSVDLVFCSPPYEDRRTYGIGFKFTGAAYVEWCKERFIECCRVSKGLVAWVIEGKTEKFQYSATPILLMAALHECGIKLRKPPIFHRVGIPGSGGPEWLRNDYEFIVCASKGRLPWSDNTACGHEQKYKSGGMESHQARDGRIKAKKKLDRSKTANPGNVIKCSVGGGRMGHQLAHENEAPFPVKLAEFFVKSFCPPDGVVLDPFGGSGTTAHAAHLNGRNSISIDIRPSQSDLTQRRMESVINAQNAV